VKATLHVRNWLSEHRDTLASITTFKA